MPSMRRRAFALATIAVIGLSGCGGGDAGEDVTVPAPADPEPPAEEPETADESEDRDDYWSNGRLAALDAAKKDYVAPAPAPPAGAGDGGATPAAAEPATESQATAEPPSASPDGEPASGSPVTAADGEAQPAAADAHRIKGFVDVPDHIWLREYSKDKPADGDDCRRERKGYEDVRPGTQVTVRDGDGRTLAVGQLEKGGLVTSWVEGKDRAMDCRLPFTVEGVPAAAFYAVEISGRGELTYPFEDLERSGWKVAFSLDW